ncbi:hypothetical protein NP233_g491 [Leucocoprinus birnbaumii]|uniref:Protein kinase domain-containing protein n=1 Tax=Leucocoprinus birnbaumii TaxID=56174 RepID=A0AAD5W1Q7_9AGAR|nr:hypothetical protein NP233_g491 [Leucocoprinus birnbaumii]
MASDISQDLTHRVYCGDLAKVNDPEHRGGYADVFIGSLKRTADTRERVAVKVLRPNEQRKNVKELESATTREAKIWQQLDHPNVLKFLGLGIHFGYRGIPVLISPWCDNGTVLEYLRTHLSLDTRLSIIHGAAKGLLYLHNQDVIHGDVKPSNILIDDDGQPLLCDFGQSYLLHSVDSLPEPAGTIRYQSPEAFREERRCTKPGDVYSFGLTCFEILTGLPPFPELATDVQIMGRMAQEQYYKLPRPDAPSPEAALYDNVLEKCWMDSPLVRPSMLEVARALEATELLPEANRVVAEKSELPDQKRHNVEVTESPFPLDMGKNYRFVCDPNGSARLGGIGGFADVYRGVYVAEGRIWLEVAIKVLRVAVSDRTSEEVARKHLIREVLVWQKLKHPNILPFIGLAFNLGRPAKFPALVSRWCGNGDMMQYLKSNPSYDQKLATINGVARGLWYLHSQQVVHGDIKPGNILVYRDGRPLLCDFGQSSIMNVRGFTTRAAGAFRYQAPELLLNDYQRKTYNMDVYSFGMTCSEIWTGQKPFTSMTTDAQVAIAILQGSIPTHPILPSGIESDLLWNVFIKCWGQEAINRPSMEAVIRMLRSIGESSSAMISASPHLIDSIMLNIFKALKATTGIRKSQAAKHRSPIAHGILTGAHDFTVQNSTITFFAEFQQPRIRDGLPRQPPPLAFIVLSQKRVPGAELFSQERQYAPRCHPDTRIELREMLVKWLSDAKRLWNFLWLSGPAGVGKSAVAQTFAEYCDAQGYIRACYFFSKPQQRTSISGLVATIACQFASQSVAYNHYITHSLSFDPFILDQTLRIQFNKLIIEPLNALSAVSETSKPFVIIIDGLDECDDAFLQCELIELIGRSVEAYGLNRRAPLLWLACSRPEWHIKRCFAMANPVMQCGPVKMTCDASKDLHDVYCILKDGLQKVHEESSWDTSFKSRALVLVWPPEPKLQRLSGMVGGLPVLASTVIKFIGDGTGTPELKLDVCLSYLEAVGQPSETNPLEGLDTIYLHIIRSVPRSLYPTTQLILGFYIYSGLRWSTSDVGRFLCLSKDMFYLALRQLHSVLDIPIHDLALTKPLMFFHKSFQDFLQDPTRSRSTLLTRRDVVMIRDYYRCVGITTSFRRTATSKVSTTTSGTTCLSDSLLSLFNLFGNQVLTW